MDVPLTQNGLVLWPLHHLQGKHVNRALHYTPKQDIEGLITEERRQQVREELIDSLNELTERPDVHKISIISEIEEIFNKRRRKEDKGHKRTGAKREDFTLDPFMTSKQVVSALHCLKKWILFSRKAKAQRLHH